MAAPPSSLPGDRVDRTALWIAGGAIALQAGIAVGYAALWNRPQGFRFFAELITLPALIAWVILALAIRWSRSSEVMERRFWARLGVAFTAMLLIRIAILVTDGRLPGGNAFSEPFYLVFYLGVILAIRLQPDAPVILRNEPVLRRLEEGGVLIFVLGVLTYFSVLPLLLDSAAYERGAPTQLQYFLLDLVALAGFSYAGARARTRGWRRIYLLMGSAFLLFVLTDLVDGLYYLNPESPAISIPRAFDHLYYIPFLFIALATLVRTDPVVDPEHVRPDAAVERALSTLVAFALVLPGFHFVLYASGILGESLRDVRGLVVYGELVVLLGLAWWYQREVVGRLRRAEVRSELAEKERELLAEAVEQSAERIAIVGPDMAIQYVNAAFAASAGASRPRLIGRSLFDFIHPIDASARPVDALSAGRAWTGRGRWPEPDGTPGEEFISIAPVVDGRGVIRHWVLTKRDRSQETRLELQLRQSQKMEALGTLAGGVAHDFNNILASIFGYVELTSQAIDGDHPAQADLGSVLKAADRARELVDQILTLSRRGDARWKNVRIDGLLVELHELSRASSVAGVEVELDLAYGLPIVRGNRSQLYQVFLNLMTNAVQATPSPGRVHVSSAREVGPGGVEGVRVEVRDGGPGVPTEIAERIFDPFFTTKPVGEGTGLGLSVAAGIVESHEGRLELLNPGQPGAHFHVWLPESTVEDDDDSESVSPGELYGWGRVILVEDEPDLARLLYRRMTEFGYEVEAYSGSVQALEAIRKDGPPDLLVTDQTMPRMTGVELVRRLRGEGFEMPVILMSGFAPGIGNDVLRELSIGALLAKPFRPETLMAAAGRLIRAAEQSVAGDLAP